MLTLTNDSGVAAGVRGYLQEHESVEVGMVEDRWVSVVVEAADDREARDTHHWLESLDGVEQVEVICVGFEESEDEQGNE